MTEESAPYGTGAAKPAAPAKRIRTQHLREMKSRGERFAMLTAYDMYTAQIFDEAGIDAPYPDGLPVSAIRAMASG